MGRTARGTRIKRAMKDQWTIRMGQDMSRSLAKKPVGGDWTDVLICRYEVGVGV